MSFTLSHLLSLFGPIFMVILMAIAGFAFSKANALSLPISPYLAAATTLLPAINGLGIYGARALIPSTSRHRTKSSSHLSGPVLIVGITLFIYETVIVTLSLTHMAPPSSLTCSLNEKWMSLFRHKNSDAIQRIQNAYRCCGLHSTRDKAWPFPDKTHGNDACVKTLGWQKSCFSDWRQDEQISAGLLLMVALLVFAFKIFALFLLRTRSSWLHRILHTPWTQNKQYAAITATGEPDAENSEAHQDNPSNDRRRIEAPYRDDADAEATSIPRGNDEENGARVQPSNLHRLQNEWSEVHNH